jgi:hypothetical protein
MFRKIESNHKADFKKDIANYPDEKIIEILKLRDYYQPEAAQQAIHEAIKRGIIFSEQDLFAEEYKVAKMDASLFPKIEDEKTKNSIRKSIARSLVICGVIPVVFGLVENNRGNAVEGSIILLFGLLWIYGSAQLIRSYHKLFVVSLFIGVLISMVYIGTKLISSNSFIFIDFFIPLSLFFLIVYGLFFMKQTCEN